MAVIFGAALLLFIALVVLMGCTTKQKVVTEYVTVHDTIRTHHTDTLLDVRVVSHTDTIRQVEWHNITLNNGGDTIKEVHHYYDRQTTTYIDSTYRYKAERDSLNKALHEEKDKERVVVKKTSQPWWEWMLILAILAATILGVKKIAKAIVS